jgi:hypothetical protein
MNITRLVVMMAATLCMGQGAAAQKTTVTVCIDPDPRVLLGVRSLASGMFPDRVQELNRSGGPSLLAHVLVHEIAHVLEGIDRHSTSGIMTAEWNDNDFLGMRRKALRFAPEDIDLIYDGLQVRNAHLGAAVAAVVAPAGIAGK